MSTAKVVPKACSIDVTPPRPPKSRGRTSTPIRSTGTTSSRRSGPNTNRSARLSGPSWTSLLPYTSRSLSPKHLIFSTLFRFIQFSSHLPGSPDPSHPSGNS